MKPTKEQIIEWARKAEQDEKGNLLPLSQVFERLAVAAYANGQEDMRDRAAKVCDDLERAFWESVSDIAQNKGRIAFAGPAQCATGIRALPIQKGGED